MFKNLLLLLALALLTLPVMAQEEVALDRSNHPNYLRSVELREQSRQALEAGDYAASIRLSNEAIEELDRFRGNNGINLAEIRLIQARERGLNVTMAERYQQAVDLVALARDALIVGNFEESILNSDRALAILNAMLGERGAPGGLVDSYTVQPGNSLWRIARMPEVYGDMHQWQRLWTANRDRLHDPENPHLIFPGQVLSVPR
ncbi:MAG: LysM peptidoglycan-binding domain-containing protein [Spirochaetaceae bacterium]|nr:LysM peptidoglycan-binding domain-containing protein [Spirochaetaceae bacterium]